MTGDRYLYAGDNPTNAVDPLGLWWLSDLFNWANRHLNPVYTVIVCYANELDAYNAGKSLWKVAECGAEAVFAAAATAVTVGGGVELAAEVAGWGASETTGAGLGLAEERGLAGLADVGPEDTGGGDIGPGSTDPYKDAEARYPKKAGKYENHHRVPRYLGGDPSGPTVRIPAAYHQLITNEFRSAWGYGQEVPSASQLSQILLDVYSKYPLP